MCKRTEVTIANQMLAMIQRNVSVASKVNRELAYNTFVRPHVGYALAMAKLLRRYT